MTSRSSPGSGLDHATHHEGHEDDDHQCTREAKPVLPDEPHVCPLSSKQLNVALQRRKAALQRGLARAVEGTRPTETGGRSRGGNDSAVSRSLPRGAIRVDEEEEPLGTTKPLPGCVRTCTHTRIAARLSNFPPQRQALRTRKALGRTIPQSLVHGKCLCRYGGVSVGAGAVLPVSTRTATRVGHIARREEEGRPSRQTRRCTSCSGQTARTERAGRRARRGTAGH